MKMKDIEVGAEYRVNYIRCTTVTVLETGLRREVTPSNRKDGVRVRLHDAIDSDALPWAKHEAEDETVISQLCFLRRLS